MKQYETFELRFAGPVLTEAWAAIDLTATFSRHGESTTVKGFYDGDGAYVVRYLPEEPGEYAWRVSGCVSAEGSEVCVPAEGAHGIVRAVDTHFEHADGTLFHPFGTTVYALASQDDDLVAQTLDTLRAAPFNKVRMCVFPKHYDYNHNEPPCYAFERNDDGSWDTGRPCIAFWRRFEGILDRIMAMGIQVDLILFHPYDRWGFNTLPQEDNLAYLDYLLRRLSAKPGIWWSLANEYDLAIARKTMADWEEIEEYTAANDPFHHLLSCHNCMCLWDATRPRVTHASIQTKAFTEIPRWLKEYGKPVMIDECAYEGNLRNYWGCISGQEMTHRFWRAVASGGYCTHGETFLAEDEVLWWGKGGRLKGESPARIRFLRDIVEGLPGPLKPWLQGLTAMALMITEELAARVSAATDGYTLAFGGSILRMKEQDRWAHLNSEHPWQARCGDECLLIFFDRQCPAEALLDLPEGKRYRVEVIDAWNMTREVFAGDAQGQVLVRLPGRESMAVLATRL
ncbi:MAG: DUF5605 domain-containing protein [Aristaeellaceae bacterium]